MKILTVFLCLLFVLVSGRTQAQKTKIFRAKIIHYDHSTVKGVVYDVIPEGVVLLDPKAVSAMSAREVRASVLTSQLPTFTVPFNEIESINIWRRRSSGRGFGLGYLASFVTLETGMATSVLSQGSRRGCDGTLQKPNLSDAFIGGSCAAPPGILVIGVASFLGGGIGSVVGAFPRKRLSFDTANQEGDARAKLEKYALLLQN